MNNPQPLVSFICKTVTLIGLNINTTDTDGVNGCDIAFDIYHKLSSSPEQVCKRAFSIEPTLFGVV